MMRFPIPDLMLGSVFELKPNRLKKMGVALLLMDLDNTLAAYKCSSPSVPLRNWIDSLKKAGIEPFIFSNSHGDRAENFARALNVDFINKARKPETKKLTEILKKKGISPSKAAIIGDQVYTDVLCGKIAGVTAIAVSPIDLSNPLYFLRFALETPFRYAYKRRLRLTEKKEKAIVKH